MASILLEVLVALALVATAVRWRAQPQEAATRGGEEDEGEEAQPVRRARAGRPARSAREVEEAIDASSAISAEHDAACDVARILESLEAAIESSPDPSARTKWLAREQRKSIQPRYDRHASVQVALDVIADAAAAGPKDKLRRRAAAAIAEWFVTSDAWLARRVRELHPLLAGELETASEIFERALWSSKVFDPLSGLDAVLKSTRLPLEERRNTLRFAKNLEERWTGRRW